MGSSKRKNCVVFLTAVVFILFGCGGIRFSNLSPEAEDFHPQALALLSLDVSGYAGARQDLDRIVTGALRDREWFQKVLSAEQVQSLMQGNETLRDLTANYLAKLKEVNFSDKELSGKIGKLVGVDAFMLVTVDNWYYTQEKDKNIAKVGLGMTLINADTGTVVWKGGHHLAAHYVFIKPELSSVAKDVAQQMIRVMPH